MNPHQCIMMHRCLRCGVRTTIDLPDELHEPAQAIARDTGRTVSETVADIGRGLGAGSW